MHSIVQKLICKTQLRFENNYVSCRAENTEGAGGQLPSLQFLYEYEYECISHIVALSLLSTSCSKKQKVIDVMSTRRGKTALG